MDIKEIGAEYAFIFNRLKKLNKAIENVVRQNTQLKIANDKLRSEHDTWLNREAARERVLKQLEDKYVPEMAIQSTEVHLDTTS